MQPQPRREPPLGVEEREALVRLLKAAADEFSTHGCNDFKLDNTDQNWALWCDVVADPEEINRRGRPSPDKKLYLEDCLLMHYLAHRIENGA